jgi:S-adenosylmethionine:tRNA ribosyltransferase-isomerase
LYFGDDDSLVAEVIDTTSRGRTRFLYDGSYEEFRKLTELGETPILNT